MGSAMALSALARREGDAKGTLESCEVEMMEAAMVSCWVEEKSVGHWEDIWGGTKALLYAVRNEG